MATIGTFTASDNGYTGSIKTLTLNIKAKFTASEKDTDKAPDYQVVVESRPRATGRNLGLKSGPRLCAHGLCAAVIASWLIAHPTAIEGCPQ